jgi:hypothetical protein
VINWTAIEDGGFPFGLHNTPRPSTTAAENPTLATVVLDFFSIAQALWPKQVSMEVD